MTLLGIPDLINHTARAKDKAITGGTRTPARTHPFLNTLMQPDEANLGQLGANLGPTCAKTPPLGGGKLPGRVGDGLTAPLGLTLSHTL